MQAALTSLSEKTQSDNTLLLFRVKELGPESKNRRPAPGEGGDSGQDESPTKALSPMGDKIINNQDLAMLCTHSVST